MSCDGGDLDLIICSGCKRHVREALCVFCGTTNELAPAPARRAAKGLTRAALVLGAAVSVAACGDDEVDLPDATTQEDATTAADAAYGAPPMDAEAGMDAPTGPDAAYGGPPDAGN